MIQKMMIYFSSSSVKRVQADNTYMQLPYLVVFGKLLLSNVTDEKI